MGERVPFVNEAHWVHRVRVYRDFAIERVATKEAS